MYKKYWDSTLTQNIASLLLSVCKAFALAFFISLALAPLTISSSFVKSALNSTSTDLLASLTAIIIFAVLVSWNRIVNFWRKLWNTLLSRSRYKIFESAVFIIVFIITMISVISENHQVSTSDEVRVFLIANLFLLLLFASLSILHSILFKNQTKELQSLRLSKADEPINTENEDLLNRGKFVQGLFNEIREVSVNDSFVFGLYGSWGDGKSSVLNLLQNKLDSDTQIIVMRFDPWNFKDEEVMLNAFFTILDATVNSNFILPNFAKTLNKYQAFITTGLSQIGINLNLSQSNESLEELKTKIENYIHSTNKKLVILIDEIDRLEDSEIRLVFKLVRSNSRFRKSVFVLSMDDRQVSKKLASIGGDEYLKKIVQKPILLPKADIHLIDKFLIMSDHPIPKHQISRLDNIKKGTLISVAGYIDKIESDHILITETKGEDSNSIKITPSMNQKLRIGERIFIEGVYNLGEITLNDPESGATVYRLSEIDEFLQGIYHKGKLSYEEISEFDKNFVPIYRDSVSSKLIENLRDAKRFLNSLESSYPSIVEEVNLFDFVSLELVKVFAREIYDNFTKYWWFYVRQRFEGDTSLNFSFFFDEDETLQKSRKHFQETLTNLIPEDRHRDSIRELTEEMFPRVSSHNTSQHERDKKRISTTVFQKYFTLDVPILEISDTYIVNMIESWNEELNEESITSTIQELREKKKLTEFLEKIWRIYLDKLNPDAIPLILNAITNNTKSFSHRDIGDIFRSEYDRALMLTLRALETRLPEGDIQKVLVSIIENSPDLLFATDLVLTTKDDRQGDIRTINANSDNIALQAMLSKRLELYFIKDNKDVIAEYPKGNGWARILYQWGSHWGSKDSPNKEKVTDYILDLTKNKPDLFTNIVKSFSSGYQGGGWTFNFQEYNLSYNLVKLCEAADKVLKDDLVNEEDKEMLTKFVSIVKQNQA